MRISIGNDHRGSAVKRKVIELVRRLGHEVQDFGAVDDGAVDYPDFAYVVAQAVAQSRFDRGILICGSGVGMSIAANKVRGVRAALCHDDLTAEMSRRHNDANVLCLAADLLGERFIERIVEIWLSTEFEGGRHARRVEKLRRIEDEEYKSAAWNGSSIPSPAKQQGPQLSSAAVAAEHDEALRPATVSNVSAFRDR